MHGPPDPVGRSRRLPPLDERQETVLGTARSLLQLTTQNTGRQQSFCDSRDVTSAWRAQSLSGRWPTVVVCSALIRCSTVGWVDSHRDHPRGARLPSSSTRSAAASSIARPWPAATPSAAYSDRRLIAALASGTSTAVSPTTSTPPAIQWPC